MATGCMRWLFAPAVRAARGVPPCARTPASRLLICSHRPSAIATATTSLSRSPFTTAADHPDTTPEPSTTKKKKQQQQHSPAKATVSSVGRRIPHALIQLMSEEGEDMGSVHRAAAIRMMDERGLKLVLLDELKEPPLYQLMSGKQIYQERIKLREKEKEKAKPAPVQVKELSFSSCIAPNDLKTKLKQVESWLEKKHHVRLTLRSRQGNSAGNLDVALEQMVDQVEVAVGFVSPPKMTADGKKATCILRLPSDKELARKGKKLAESAQRDDSSKTAAEDWTDESTPPPSPSSGGNV